MRSTDDAELLEAWRDRGDRAAMDELVRRNIHFVYGAARRQVRDAAWAEDVTQAVFMLLIRKAPRLSSESAVAVWLHRAARYASANARRMRQRQTERERRAARHDVQEFEPTQAQEYRELIPVLDEAIERLGPRDRSGVVMRYFQQRSYRQIGATLGITEEAARKRVARAVGRMRDYFAARGVVTTGVAVASCLSAQSAVAAPAPLVGATASLATVSQLAGTSASSAAIMKGVVHAMLVAKMKLAAAACAAVMVGGVVTGATIQQITAPLSAPVVTSTTLALTAEAEPLKATADKTEVEVLGLARWGAEASGWWAPDGSKTEDPRGPFADEQLRAPPETTHQAMLHVSGANLSGGYSVRIPQASKANMYDLTPSPDEAYLLVPFAVAKDQKTADIEVHLAEGEWKTVGTSEHVPGRPLGDHETEFGGIALTHLIEGPGGGSILYVAHDIKGPQFEPFVTDAQGTEHRCDTMNGGDVGKFVAVRFDWRLPPDEVSGVVLKVRPFNKRVIAKNVSLDPAHPTKPQIAVETIEPKK